VLVRMAAVVVSGAMMLRLLSLLAVFVGANAAVPTNTLTTTQTGTTTQTATWTLTNSAASSTGAVYVTLLIEGIDYSLLVARPTLRAQLELELKQAIAAGQTFSQYGISVDLSSGSLLVTFRILPGAGADFTTLAQQLRLARNSIAQRAAALLRTIPGIAEVTVGTVTVRVCGLARTREQALASCLAVAPTATGSMPANLNSALMIGGVAANDGLLNAGVLNAYQGDATRGPHPALMFGLGLATALALAVPLAKKLNVRPVVSTAVE